MRRKLNTGIMCYSMSRVISSPAGGLGQAMMALLSVFGRNFVPKVRGKLQPADRDVEV